MSRQTLCWDCKNAGGGCSWSKEFKPVKDWEAKKAGDSFTVIKCPMFNRESYGFGLYRTADDYIIALETENRNLKRDKKRLQNLLGSVVWECTHYGEC